MAYDEKLNVRVREALSHLQEVEEKYMFGGACYMVNNKMCIGILGNELMCRIDHEVYDKMVEMPGCRPMDFTGKSMRGYVFVSAEGMKTKKQFDQWITLCLDFNKRAKASKKKKK